MRKWKEGCTIDASTHYVHLVVSGPDVVNKRPVFLEDICAHGEGNGHFEEEVADLPGVRGELEASHAGGGRLACCLIFGPQGILPSRIMASGRGPRKVVTNCSLEMEEKGEAKLFR